MYAMLSDATAELHVVSEVTHLINIKETKFGNFTEARYHSKKHPGELHSLRSKIGSMLKKEGV
jgi:hypothetical protein